MEKLMEIIVRQNVLKLKALKKENVVKEKKKMKYLVCVQ